jgi:pilus assembly protein Flp/PilA
MKMTRRPGASVGQGMTEYLIIVALIAISAIAIIRTTSSSVKVAFGKIAAAIQGRSYEGSEAEEVTSDKTKGRSLGDFDRGAAGR